MKNKILFYIAVTWLVIACLALTIFTGKYLIYLAGQMGANYYSINDVFGCYITSGGLFGILGIYLYFELEERFKK